MKSMTEEEIATVISYKISEEIDAAFMADIYRDAGWTEVRIPRPTRQARTDVIDWCKSLDMVYHSSGPIWLFKDAKDATLFILRWS